MQKILTFLLVGVSFFSIFDKNAIAEEASLNQHISIGSDIYYIKCRVCHDVPDFPQLSKLIKSGKLDRATFASTVINGKNSMPKFVGTFIQVGSVLEAGYTEEQAIDAVYSYLEFLDNEDVVNDYEDIDNKQLIPMANWASIHHGSLFNVQYSQPATWDFYRYICFNNGNCIGINQTTQSVDVLINDRILSVGSVESVMTIINGVINLSGDPINNMIPATFSPVISNAITKNGRLAEIIWKNIVNEGTNQQEELELIGVVNSLQRHTLDSITFRRYNLAGSVISEWKYDGNRSEDLMLALEELFNKATVGLSGFVINQNTQTMSITENVTLSNTIGNEGDLTILSGELFYH